MRRLNSRPLPSVRLGRGEPVDATVIPLARVYSVASEAHRLKIVWVRVSPIVTVPAQIVPSNSALRHRAKSLGKLLQENIDVELRLFGCGQPRTANLANDCVTFRRGIPLFYNVNQVRSGSRLHNGIVQLLAMCMKPAVIPALWWRQGSLLENFTTFQGVTPETMNRFENVMRNAVDEHVYWSPRLENSVWPVQVLPRPYVEQYFPEVFKTGMDDDVVRLPCVEFGTGNVLLESEIDLFEIESGIVRGFPHQVEDDLLRVAISELWGYLQEERIWPSGMLSGKHWWNIPSLPVGSPNSIETREARMVATMPFLGQFTYVEQSTWAKRPRKYRLEEDTWDGIKCNCLMTRGAASCDQSSCINFSSKMICSELSCSLRRRCTNLPFELRSRPMTRITYCADSRGWGLAAAEFIPSGSFVLEYVGEILTENQRKQRVRDIERIGKRDYYLARLSRGPKGLTLDGGAKGNLARFINTSCNPNCVMHEWIDGSMSRLGLFATEDIFEGRELSLEYFSILGGNIDCECGSTSCVSITEEGKEYCDALLNRSVETLFDEIWYHGTIQRYNARLDRFFIKYEDGDSEYLPGEVIDGTVTGDVDIRLLPP